MKTKIVKVGITTIVLILQACVANAQFNQINFGTWIGRTNGAASGTNISAVGIGDFTALPGARLHVNNFLCAQPTGTLNGFLFRTDGRSNVANLWQMYTGNNANNVTEKFRLFVAANSNHVTLQSTFGDIRFNAGGVFERVRISGTTGFVSIGQTNNFTAASVVHINANGMNTGEVFRTSGPANQVNAWRMFTGTGNGTEKASFYIPANSGDLVIQTQTKSNMLFNVTQVTRMIVTDGTNPGVQTGLVGIGNNFLSPTSQLHLNDGAFATCIQFTNASTNASLLLPAANDGFTVGITNNGTALLNQQENPPMWFRVNNINAMQIEPDGLITINSLASCTDMLVIADKNGTLKTTDTETLLSQSKTIAQLQTRINELENKLSNLTTKNN
ncbi:MAG: hypothetical protein HY958_04015 [Bacteroidia bacterium]|nr:hypothetical protein [Bacteroidia bacterium]